MTSDQERKLDDVIASNERIEKRLLGDKLTGTPSLIDDVDDLKRDVKKLNNTGWKKIKTIISILWK